MATTSTTKKTTEKKTTAPKATTTKKPATTAKKVPANKPAEKAVAKKVPASTAKKAPAKTEVVKKEAEAKKPAATTTDANQKISKKEQERKRLLNTKTIFKENKEFALRLKNVKKSFGFKQVLKGVSFDIRKGERLAMIGKNGAGKSTLINVIAQQTRMSSGEIRYGYASNRVESLERMGIQFQSLNYPEGFIVKDVIKFFNASVEKTIRMSNRELSDMISMFGIDKYLNQAIDRLSGGQQQRINILLALIKKPHLLILDEISTGLDVESAEVIKGYINQFLLKYPETALLLISHSEEEIVEMSERTIVLEAGKIVEDFPSKKLTAKLFLEITSREAKLTKKEKEKQEAESEKHLKALRRSYFDKKVARSIREGEVTEEQKLTFSQKTFKWFEDFKHKFDLKFDPLSNETLDEGNSVELRGVSKTYGKTVGAVRNVSLDIEEGSRIAITGPNGSGKSTIVEIIAQVKHADREKDKFTNLVHLAKADHDNTLEKLEENLHVTIRQRKNKYRLDRELAYNEAKELEKSKNALAKEIKEKKSITLAEAKEQIDAKIAKIVEKADKVANQAKEELAKEEVKLMEQKKKDMEAAEKQLELDLAAIQEQKEEYAKDNNYRYSDPYLLNGKELKGKAFRSEKPMLAYSFAETGRQVRDNVGVQFQYASFPVEMTVLDVLLFFSRTNKYFMTKDEIVEAVKVFKLEKLLKARAYSLSGGERQRLNVLLAIMKSPKLLILDEISTGLDVDSIVKIDAFIKEYLDRTKATLILISHNYHEVDSLTDKIVVMKYGRLTEIVDTKGWTTAQTKEKMRDIYRGGATGWRDRWKRQT